MSKLTNSDYKNILKFYKMTVPKSTRILRKKAESIMSTKLCKCIKKIDKSNEAKSIRICTKTIFENKGITRGKFTCKKRRSVNMTKKRK
jgi:hypothetical protein